jgi:hypothetical protein
VRFDRRGVDLGASEAREFALGERASVIGGQLREFAAHGLDLRVQFADLRAQRGDLGAAEPVEHVEGERGREQTLCIVLTGDVDERTGERAHLTRAGRDAVDARLRAARCREFAGDDEVIVVGEHETAFGASRAQRFIGLELQHDTRARCAAANHVGVGAFAQREAQRTEQHRFARSGFTAEHR